MPVHYKINLIPPRVSLRAYVSRIEFRLIDTLSACSFFPFRTIAHHCEKNSETSLSVKKTLWTKNVQKVHFRHHSQFYVIKYFGRLYTNFSEHFLWYDASNYK